MRALCAARTLSALAGGRREELWQAGAMSMLLALSKHLAGIPSHLSHAAKALAQRRISPHTPPLISYLADIIVEMT